MLIVTILIDVNFRKCYVRDSACRWLIVENAKIFLMLNKKFLIFLMLNIFEFSHVKATADS